MTNIFENITPKNIEKLKRILKTSTIKFSKNVNILSNVNLGDFIGIIDSGSVQLIYNDYNGNKILLEDIKKGEMFGSLDFSLDTEELSCISKEPTQITFIEYNQITNDEIVKTDFYIIFIKNLIKILNEQITKKNERIELLTKKTTRDKLIEYLKKTSQKKGTKKFELPMTYTELASYLSVDRSAMTREMKYLKEDGFIETKGKIISISEEMI